jgi:hypothetical protein
MAANRFAISKNAVAGVESGSGDDVALDASEVALLQACVGFHAKAQSDPGIRDRLYQLWCKLDVLKQAA